LLNTDDFTIEKSNISEENPLPIDAVTLLKPISMMRYKGSHCFIWSDGQVVGVYGNVVWKGMAARALAVGQVNHEFAIGSMVLIKLFKP
jgi:hypothetical protein